MLQIEVRAQEISVGLRKDKKDALAKVLKKFGSAIKVLSREIACFHQAVETHKELVSLGKLLSEPEFKGTEFEQPICLAIKRGMEIGIDNIGDLAKRQGLRAVLEITRLFAHEG